MNDDKKRYLTLMNQLNANRPGNNFATPKFRPQYPKTQPTPQPQKPQQSFFNKVRDTFDANTEADYYRRSMEQVKNNQPVQRQSYTQQQQETRRDNVQSIELNPFKRIWQETTEAPRRIGIGLSRNSGQQAKTDQSTLNAQTTRDSVILNAQRKIKNPLTSPMERARWIKYLEKEYPQAQIDDRETRMQLRRNIKDADPVAGVAAVAEMGLDAATLGAGGVVFKGARQAAKQGIKPLLRFAGKNIAVPILPAAAGGGIGAVTSQGSDVTPGQIAVGTAAGATLGLLFSAGASAVGGGSRVISDAFNSGAGKKVVQDLAKETDIEEVIIKLQEAGVPQNKAVEVAQDIATSTTAEQVENTLRRAANAPDTISENVVNAITTIKQPEQLRDAIKTLFPNFDDNTIVQLSRQLAETTDNNSIRQILEEAQVRSNTLKETTQQATPTDEQVAPNSQAVQNQAQLEQMATEQPIQPTGVADETIDAQPTTTAVQGATTADNVPGSVNAPDQRAPVTIGNKTDTVGNFITRNISKAEKKGLDSSLIGREYNEGINTRVLAVEDLRTDKSKEGLTIIGDLFVAKKGGEPELVLYTIDHTEGTLARKAAKEAEMQQKLDALDAPKPEPVQTPPNTPDAVPGAVDINLADAIAQRAKESRELYAEKSNLQKAKEIWEPRTAAIQVDKMYAKSIDKKLRDINKAESLEALIERSGQAKEIAAEYLKESNIASVIQKYGRNTVEERDFNTYRLFKRDLEQRADGRPALFREYDDATIQKWVDEYQARNPEAEQDLRQLVTDVQAVQDMAVYSDSPFISAEEMLAARTKKDGSQYEFYTPAQRAMPEETASANIQAQNVGTLGRQKVLQEMTGSDIPLDPTFDALTDYTETVFKQLGQARVVQKYADRVKDGIIPGAKFIVTGDETARIAQLKNSITELRDIQKSLKGEIGRTKTKVRLAKKDISTAEKQLRIADEKQFGKVKAAELQKARADKAATARAREILRETVGEDVDAASAIDNLSDAELLDVLDVFTQDELFSKGKSGRAKFKQAKSAEAKLDSTGQPSKSQQTGAERVAQRSQTYNLVAQKLNDLKLDMESVANAKSGLGRELVDLQPDPFTGRQTILGIDEKGNKFRIEVPPEHAELLQGLGKEKMNDALRAVRVAQQPFREAFTGILNPSFQLAQATYNTMMLPIISDQGIRTLGPRAVYSAIKSFNSNSEFQQLLRKNGAIRYGGNLSKLVNDSTADALASQADALSKAKWYANPKRAWGQLSLLGGKLDQAARTASGQAAYDAAIRSNKTPEVAIADAVYAYNNVLPNFSNLSSLVKGADALVMYTGAGQAGTRTIMRAISRNPAKVTARFAVAGTALTGIAAYNMFQDQGEAFYADMQNSGKQYVLDNNVVIVLPGARKDPKTGEWTGIVKLPISPELRPINASIQRTMYNSEPGIPVKQYALSIFDFVTGQSRQATNPALQLGYGIATGKDPRTGQDIYDETMTDEEKREAIKKYTGRSLGVAGQAFGDKGLSAFTDSIVNKVYGAKGLSEGGQYYKNEKDAIKEIGLNQNELKAYQSTIAPRSKDLAGNSMKDKTYYDAAARATTWLKYPKTFEVSKAMDAKNREAGKPGDPLYDLPPDQLKIALNLMANYSPGNKEEKAIAKLNPWLEDFNKRRSEYFEQVIPENDGTDAIGMKIPKASDDLQSKIDQSSALTDSAAKAQFHQENPEVTDFFTEVNNYQRAKRNFLGLPQFDDYPTPTPEVQGYMDEYNKLPSKNGPLKKDGTPSSPDRSNWIKNNPDKFAKMTDQWTKQDIYRLQEEGSLAVYEGIDFSEDGIKSIQDIAGALGGDGSGGFGYSSGSKKDETPRQYLGTLLAGVKPSQIGSQPNIDFTPTRSKFRVKTPSGRGRNFRRIKLN